ncbi:hypothetical protein R0J89_21890, partial [Psychrobacter sp. SIMBA_152]
GQAFTKSRDSVDTDIVAFENYILAILFYDRLVAVDDYIPAHRDARIASFPDITFLSKSDFNLDEIEATATAKANQLQPR